MSSTYPTAPGSCFTSPATPGLPLPPTPTGQFSDCPTPTLVFQSADTLPRQSLKTAVVPLPSERCTTVIAVFGSFTEGFRAVILASFHRVIVPRNIPDTTSG